MIPYALMMVKLPDTTSRSERKHVSLEGDKDQI